MTNEKKQALAFLHKIRTECRISHTNGAALTGAEYDSIREAIAILAKEDVPEAAQETPPTQN